jgi:endogenous inhibitor of DNA gyrase (YacG/DUF329 family)
MSKNRTPKRKKQGCPICKKTVAEAWRPFCSKHCADIDLGRWLDGNYRIPVVEEDESADGLDMDDGEMGSESYGHNNANGRDRS